MPHSRISLVFSGVGCKTGQSPKEDEGELWTRFVHWISVNLNLHCHYPQPTKPDKLIMHLYFLFVYKLMDGNIIFVRSFHINAIMYFLKIFSLSHSSRYPMYHDINKYNLNLKYIYVLYLIISAVDTPQLTYYFFM